MVMRLCEGTNHEKNQNAESFLKPHQTPELVGRSLLAQSQGWDVGMQPSDSLKTAKQALKGEQLNPDVLQCPTCRCQLEGVYNSLGSVYLYSSGAEGPFDGGFGVAVRMRSALGTATGLGRLCPHWPLPGGICAARLRVSPCACAGLVPGNELGER